MSSGRIAQHRNYGEVMARHERDLKLRRISRAFIYFLVIVFMVLVFLFVRKWEEIQRGKTQPKRDAAAMTVKHNSNPQTLQYARH